MAGPGAPTMAGPAAPSHSSPPFMASAPAPTGAEPPPTSLMLSVILAGFPAIASITMGLLMLIGAALVDDFSRSNWDSSAGATDEVAGYAILFIGLGVLVLAASIASGRGRSWGRVTILVFLGLWVLLVIILASAAADSVDGDGSGPAIVLAFIYPGIILFGQVSTTSRRYFMAMQNRVPVSAANPFM